MKYVLTFCFLVLLGIDLDCLLSGCRSTSSALPHGCYRPTTPQLPRLPALVPAARAKRPRRPATPTLTPR